MSRRRVSISNLHPRLRVDRAAVVRALRALDGGSPPLARPGSAADGSGDLSLVFLTDAALAELHSTFLGDPSVTDVITFDHSDAPSAGMAGEEKQSGDCNQLTLTFIAIAGPAASRPARSRSPPTAIRSSISATRRAKGTGSRPKSRAARTLAASSRTRRSCRRATPFVLPCPERRPRRTASCPRISAARTYSLAGSRR